MDKQEAMKILKEFHDKSALFSVRTALETALPELLESEDERIRKEIIAILQYKFEKFSKDPKYCNAPQWIAWLEKQGQTFTKKDVDDAYLKGVCDAKQELEKQDGQKPFDYENATIVQKDFAPKEEPKFHEGDWVVYNNDICQIVKREEGCNKLVTVFGIEKELVNERNLSTARLWTIKDAKDGDVLACESGWTCIFKTLVNDENFSSYCFMDNTKWVCETGSECHTLKEEFVKAYNGKIYPATKEQCDTLMKAMADAGWEFDFEKKELKKIDNEEVNGEDYGIDGLWHAQRILEKTLGSVDGYQTDDGILDHKCAISAVKKLYEQNPVGIQKGAENLEEAVDDAKDLAMRDMAWNVHVMISEGKSISEIDHYVCGICDF